jgi:hypothetical protein
MEKIEVSVMNTQGRRGDSDVKDNITGQYANARIRRGNCVMDKECVLKGHCASVFKAHFHHLIFCTFGEIVYTTSSSVSPSLK